MKAKISKIAGGNRTRDSKTQEHLPQNKLQINKER